MAAKKKLTLYFPEDMLDETRQEAERQDRSLSWIIQTAWKIARGEIQAYPSVDDLWSEEKVKSTG
jgi:uncharacterized small protein (TIGR04563 family)